MSRKQLNVDAVVNELRGQSAFFRKDNSSSPHPQPTNEAISQSHPPKIEAISAPVTPSEQPQHGSSTSPPPSSSPSPSQPSSVETMGNNPVDDGSSASVLASNQASLLASYHASIIDVIRKTVKTVGKEVTFVRLTPEEKNRLTDIAYTYKRRGIKTSENEISRIAINFLLEDYKTNGEASVLARVLASLLA